MHHCESDRLSFRIVAWGHKPGQGNDYFVINATLVQDQCGHTGVKEKRVIDVEMWEYLSE